MIYAIVLLVLFLLNYDTDYYYPKWYFLFLVFSAIMGYAVYIDTNIFVAGFYFYLLVSSGTVAINHYLGHFINFNPATPNIPRFNFQLGYEALLATVYLIVLGIIGMFLKRYEIDTILSYMSYIGIIGALLSFVPFKMKCKRTNTMIKIWGFGANKSVNATLLSLIAPLCFYGNIYAALIANVLILAAIIRSDALAGMAGFVLSSVIVGYKFIGFYSLLFFIIPIAGALWTKYKMNLPFSVYFSDNGRFAMMRKIFSYLTGKEEFQPNRRIYGKDKFGVGVGTFSFIVPLIQMVDAQKNKEDIKKKKAWIFIWMHNDYIQFFIEAGYFGLVLLSVFIASIIYSTMHIGDIFALAFFASFAINAMANFPSHMAPDALLLTLMIKKVTI